jgi:hypothetical protein
MFTLRGSRSLTSCVESTSHNQDYAVIKRIVSQPLVPNTQPPAPSTPSKFQFQIIALPDPHKPALHEFQAEVLGEFGSSLTPTQITALRCYHPALWQYDTVYFSTVGRSQYIVVSTGSLNKAVKNPRSLPLKIGGYQVHSLPDIYTPSDRFTFTTIDLINTTIDPHRTIEPKIAAIIQQYFKFSIGVHLLVFGHLVVLFPDIKSLRRTKLRKNMPLNIGKLSYSFDVLSMIPSSLSAISDNISVAAVTATNRLQPPPAIGHSRNLLWFGLAIGRLLDAWLNGLDGLTTAM